MPAPTDCALRPGRQLIVSEFDNELPDFCKALKERCSFIACLLVNLLNPLLQSHLSIITEYKPPDNSSNSSIVLKHALDYTCHASNAQAFGADTGLFLCFQFISSQINKFSKETTV